MLTQVNIHNIELLQQFNSCSDEYVVLNKVKYTNNIIVTNNSISALSLSSIDLMQLNHIDEIVADDIDLLLLGSSKRIIYPPYEVFTKLKQYTAVEVMMVQSLCKTYNFLVSEGRKVKCLICF